ncbi:MAG: lecithin retinol acyltransferase family protein [Phycisphaeraceae bacterium]|nr:lecithin retinol acyltransferase family protein [Phycisphaeraceae bacterium]MCW5753639.1 lecithin retinol acyltransferase family protein [Phycisphaeraceae bacterium]
MDSRSALRPQPGSAVAIHRGAYEHYVLYAGSVTRPGGVMLPEMVVHLDAKREDPHVALARFREVVGDRPWRIVDMPPAFSREEIVRRGMESVGRTGYDLVNGNCEHFVRWCITGTPESRQVKRAATAAQTAARFAAAAACTAMAAGVLLGRRGGGSKKG